MKNDSLAQNPFLKKLARTFDRGDVIFEQGDPGNTVFLILQGSVNLIAKRSQKESIIGSVSAGEFIGEKALLQDKPFPRFCSAVAAESVFVIELGATQFAQLEKDAPAVFNVLLKKAFKTCIQRLDASNQLVSCLRNYDPRKRFLDYVKYVFAHFSQPNFSGRMALLSDEDIAFQIGCSSDEVGEWLATLCDLNILQADQNHSYTTQDEHLLDSVSFESLAQYEAA